MPNHSANPRPHKRLLFQSLIPTALAAFGILAIAWLISEREPWKPGGYLWDWTWSHSRDAPQWTPDESRLVFRSLIDLYSVKSDGSELTRLTKSHGSFSPSISPDGKKIAFTKYYKPRLVFFRGRWSIATMNIDGSGEKRLTKGEGARLDLNPSWSPDGTQIAFAAERGPRLPGHHNIFLIRPDGTGLRKLETPRGTTEHGVVWSPDGTRMAYLEPSDSLISLLATIKADGSDRKEIGPAVSLPLWSEDGTYLTFRTQVLEKIPSTSKRRYITEIRRANLDSSEMTTVASLNPWEDRVKERREEDKALEAIGYREGAFSTWAPSRSRIAHLEFADDGTKRIFTQKAVVFTTDPDGFDIQFLTRATESGIVAAGR